MTAKNARTVARELYQAYQTREFETVARSIADDAEILNAATGDWFHGADGFLQLARGWVAALPDLQVDLHHVGGDDETGVVEYTFRGTHTGALISPGGFVPPTWSQVELRLCDVVQLRHGRVVRIASYFDSGTMLRQMGLLPNSPLHAAERRASLGLFASEVDGSVEQRNKAIVQRFLEEVVNQKNPAAASATCAPDLAWHGGPIGETDDLPGFQSAAAALFSSFPDLHLEIHELTAEEDRVAVRVTLHGTHLGAFQGIAPTGKRITSAGMNGYRIADDLIVEEWWQHDLLGVLRQLDALPTLAKTRS